MPDVLCELDDDGVALVTLNRPEKLNAFTSDMQWLYCRTLHELDLDPACRAIVVTGAGRGWSAGADLSTLAVLATGERPIPSGEFADVDPGWVMTLDTPLIAAVNGPVAGMAFSFMLMADVRYAAEGARISSTFARLGLVAEWGSSWLLPRLVGTGRAAEILLSGDSYTAEELAELGMVQRVLPAEELVPAALAWARKVATQCSPRSAASIKRQLRDSATQPPRAAYDESVALMMDSFAWPDLTEAVAARAEKRSPQFPGYPTTEGSLQ